MKSKDFLLDQDGQNIVLTIANINVRFLKRSKNVCIFGKFSILKYQHILKEFTVNFGNVLKTCFAISSSIENVNSFWELKRYLFGNWQPKSCFQPNHIIYACLAGIIHETNFKLKKKPNTFYQYWINSDNEQHFKTSMVSWFSKWMMIFLSIADNLSQIVVTPKHFVQHNSVLNYRLCSRWSEPWR